MNAITVQGSNLPATPTAEGLVEAFLRGRSEATRRAYDSDLHDFAQFLGERTPRDAARVLLSQNAGKANALVLAYRQQLQERRLSAATVNRRLAALRSLVKLGRTLGLVSWRIEVEGVKSQAYRDTRGPGADGFEKMLRAVEADSPKSRRDRAILHLLFNLALRRIEVARLDVEDLDLEAGTLSVRGKGRSSKQRLTLPTSTRAVLRTWLCSRGQEAGPLFLSMDRAAKGDGRLAGKSINRVVKALASKVGVKCTAHGLRHAAITTALDRTNGDVRRVRKFSRHANVETVLVYDDARSDVAGEVAELVSTRQAVNPWVV